MSSLRDRSPVRRVGSPLRGLDLEPETLAAELASVRSRGSERWGVLRRYLAVADVAAAVTGGALAAAVAGMPLETGALLLPLAAALWFAVVFITGLYAADDLRSWASGVAETPRLFVAGLISSWPLFAIASALGAPRAIAGALVGSVAIAALSGLTRAAARTQVHKVDPLRQRTVIVGSGYVAGQLVQKLKAQPQFGLEPFGIVDDDPYKLGSPDLPTLGRLDDLSDILRLHKVDRVIIAFTRANHEELLRVIRACRDRRVAVDVVPRLFEFLDGARALDQVGGMPLLSIGAHRLSRTSHAAKRALDVVVSALALVVLSPFLFATAIAIRLESRGPVFFRQIRAGRGGQTFKLIKFRSMYADAEQRKAALQKHNDNSDGVMFKIHDDPRVTGVGRFIRKYSIDELPQLLNVLRGEMSLVGPRPLILPETAALAETWHQRRLDLRPGITGPWQISGRSDVTFQEMVRFDYQYVAGWSLARDIEILFETVPAVLSGRGAY